MRRRFAAIVLSGLGACGVAQAQTPDLSDRTVFATVGPAIHYVYVSPDGAIHHAAIVTAGKRRHVDRPAMRIASRTEDMWQLETASRRSRATVTISFDDDGLCWYRHNDAAPALCQAVHGNQREAAAGPPQFAGLAWRFGSMRSRHWFAAMMIRSRLLPSVQSMAILNSCSAKSFKNVVSAVSTSPPPRRRRITKAGPRTGSYTRPTLLWRILSITRKTTELPQVPYLEQVPQIELSPQMTPPRARPQASP